MDSTPFPLLTILTVPSRRVLHRLRTQQPPTRRGLQRSAVISLKQASSTKASP